MEENREEAIRRVEQAKHEGKTTLDLGGLGLASIPEAVFQLRNLQRLDLCNNKLLKLPSEIQQLQDLQWLDLSDNRLVSLPREIGQLNRLHYLYLRRNQLEYLPAEIGLLDSLWHLSVSENRLSTLPPEIGHMRAMRSLSARDNRLTSLPESMRGLSPLQELFLHDNPRLGIPSAVLGSIPLVGATRDPQDILEYYFRTRNGAQGLNEAKLILVGRGGVGKTTLVQRLMTGEFVEMGKTKGIRINKWQLDLKRDDQVQLNVWDFGGQEIMHSTHQFFLTERSLYLLVVSGREDRGGEDAEYWMKTICGFGGDSPVIVVLNKQVEHPFDLNRGALQLKYPNIAGFVQTDCESGLGIKELLARLRQVTAGLEGLRAKFPADWFRIKERLSGMKENYLTYEKYREECKALGESDEDAQDKLAGFLHVLGVALNFRDDRLSDMHVLNPHWVVNGIYKIINDDELSARNGVLHEGDLRKILPAKEYPRRMHSYLIDLMCKFDLCFSLPDAGSYLVPDLLGIQQPDAASGFKPEDCLNFHYSYGSTPIPEGLLPRFIVRSHTLSRPSLRWRSGAILDFEGASALVRADKAEKRVTISIHGDEAASQRLLAIIRADFSRIHSAFEGLRPTELLAVPGHPLDTVPYADILDAERQDWPDIPIRVDGKLSRIDVKTLRTIVMPEQPASKPPFVFVSYSHKDKKYLDRLLTHLKILKGNGLIRDWHDRGIPAGAKWKGEIDQKLRSADIAIMLVSPDFLASDYCSGIELTQALEQDHTTVVPVIARVSSWTSTPLGDLEALPIDGKPITKHGNRDEGWLAVETGVRKVAEDIRRRRD